ncbi:MAG: multicopper oxidase family protein [Proteobacteria bacterium]|nr:multicopper oxidase family protein [Pseudomonadota bacterium]
MAKPYSVSRRTVLIGAAGLAATATLPAASARGANSSPALRLTAAPARVRLVGGAPETAVWCYDGRVPGPELRLPQGERVRVDVINGLPEPTTVHWHGIRTPNAMDGVPDVTQPAIAPGQSFSYVFDLPDAGTYWYHPHYRSAAQVGRGLFGAIIVAEREAVAVDRDVVWVLHDWRLGRDAQDQDDFGNMMDASHAGRLGNTVTLNGQVPEKFAVRAGERLRLRLINAANARIFGLDFTGHRPWIVALDGQPIAPHQPADGRIVLGPAQRVDVILDMAGEPGRAYAVVDGFYARQAYRLVDLAYEPGAAPRSGTRGSVPSLPPNALAEPDLERTERHAIEFGGGMMDPKMMRGGMGGMMGMMDRMGGGMAWTINGRSASGHLHEPMLSLRTGRSYLFAMVNDTAWHHPIHLHGMVFRVLRRDGAPVPRPEWRDTVLMAPGERVEIAFVADNPGDWMFHCHILEHQEAGMMATIRVA